MALIRDVTTVVEIPHEPGQTVTIRRLTWRQLAQARSGREKEQRAGLRELGADFLKALREGAVEAPEGKPTAAEPEPAYTVAQFALGELLLLGVVAWSYPEAVTASALDLLDEQTAQWLGQAILDFTRPPDQAARKND